MKRLFIVGNDAFTVHAMRFTLRYSSGVNLFGVIDGQGSVRQAVKEADPDVVVVDGLTDPESAVARIAEIRDEVPDALVLIVTGAVDGPALKGALEAGAIVCLWRDAQVPQLDATAAEATVAPAPATALMAPPAEEAAQDHCPLTARELEILRWVAEGHTNARIARKLWVTEQTVKFHLSNIYRKLGVTNRTEASRYALVNDLFGTRRRAARQAGLVTVNGHAAPPLAPASS